jgi:hypothetical protein
MASMVTRAPSRLRLGQLVGHAELRQREAGIRRTGAERVEGFERLALVVVRQRGLAIDRDEACRTRPQRLNPAVETMSECQESTRFTRVQLA